MTATNILAQCVCDQVLSRRGFLSDAFSGLAGIGLTTLLNNELRANPGPGLAHFPAKVKRVLQIFCPGGASHMDLWVYKPALAKVHKSPACDMWWKLARSWKP